MNQQQAIQSLKKNKYVNFTTFRKNGDRKSTPIWIAAGDETVFVWSDRDTWKIKRVTNNPKCEMTPCNVTGSKNIGATIFGTVIDADMIDKKRAKRMFRKKYGPFFTVLETAGRLRPGSDHVYLEIQLDPSL